MSIRQRASGDTGSTGHGGAQKDEAKSHRGREKQGVYEHGTNFVEAGVEANAILFGLILAAPLLSLLLAYVTSPAMVETYGPDLGRNVFSQLVPQCVARLDRCVSTLANVGWSVVPTREGAALVASFMGVALLLEQLLPGKIECGPVTQTGHIPKYVDNGVLHCLVFSLLFVAGSNFGPADLYDFGIIYDVFPGAVAFLNIFGLVFCAFLMVKGLYFPSTRDSGSSGSWVKDYLWGTELYPRLLGGKLDIKRFINCRFSMTFWQLAGLSFCYRSYTSHGTLDWGLFFSAVSQYLYLFKFFVWEMGYMRSIDIIVDRAGFEIQWGCLVWVPAVYTLHSRFLVQYPSGYSFPAAAGLFVISILGVLLNYLADRERDVFRATQGKALVWGKPPKFIRAKYTVIDPTTGQTAEKTSLLLASGFWGMARHFQYFFELTAAWSWCLLANPFRNGCLPLFYAVFLTYLLVDRAQRDTNKCQLKYGMYYEEYCQLVPFKIVPGLY